jgi:hypothetical protein
MILRVKKSAVIKIADTSTGEAPKESRIVRRNFEKVSNREGSERREPIHDGTTPRGIRTIRAKKMQEAVDE